VVSEKWWRGHVVTKLTSFASNSELVGSIYRRDQWFYHNILTAHSQPHHSLSTQPPSECAIGQLACVAAFLASVCPVLWHLCSSGASLCSIASRQDSISLQIMGQYAVVVTRANVHLSLHPFRLRLGLALVSTRMKLAILQTINEALDSART
jgi:hypothetical protein